MDRVMKQVRRGAAVTAIFFILNSVGWAASISLSLLPSTSISGPAGSTVGWGYRITNSTSNWVETLNLTADIFTNGTPVSIFDFPVIAPNSFVAMPFSQALTAACLVPDCGLFEFTWNPGVLPGTTNSGTFTITSEFFGTNPLTDPNAIDLGAGPDVTASYSVRVSAPTVPEPSSLFLLVPVFAVFIILQRRRVSKCARFS
jgi:hypothetical protein